MKRRNDEGVSWGGRLAGRLSPAGGGEWQAGRSGSQAESRERPGGGCDVCDVCARKARDNRCGCSSVVVVRC